MLDQNQVVSALHDRVTVRDFNDEAITAEELQAIMEAGRATPTAMNRQTRLFTGVLNQALIADLAKALG